MSIWLPQLPLDRRVRMGDPRTSGVFAIISEVKNAYRLTHMTKLAHDAGLKPCMSVPDARAICPELLTEMADPAREETLLRALRRWADKLSPWIALDKPDGLTLDVSGCAHLFGGEAKMAQYALGCFEDMQITANIGVADTKGAAQALARFRAEKIAISISGETSEDLRPLPVEALRLDAKTPTALRRVGLKTIGQLYSIAHSELARRYGLKLPQALSRALGQSYDPIAPLAADPVFAASMNLPEPIGLKSDLQDVLERLTASVCTKLEKARLGARQFRLTVRCVDTGDHILPIGFAKPCFDAALVKRQFERPLDEFRIKFGADWFRLIADTIEPIKERQGILDGAEQDALDDLAQVITTLGNRLGFDRIRRFIPQDSHIPYREFATIEVADTQPVSGWPEPDRHRPIRIFKPERLRTLEAGRPPIAFEWRKEKYKVQSSHGPERLSAEWWQNAEDEVKDYWAVETEVGARLWLLTYPKRGNPDWYVTGKFL